MIVGHEDNTAYNSCCYHNPGERCSKEISSKKPEIFSVSTSSFPSKKPCQSDTCHHHPYHSHTSPHSLSSHPPPVSKGPMSTSFAISSDAPTKTVNIGSNEPHAIQKVGLSEHNRTASCDGENYLNRLFYQKLEKNIMNNNGGKCKNDLILNLLRAQDLMVLEPKYPKVNQIYCHQNSCNLMLNKTNKLHQQHTINNSDKFPNDTNARISQDMLGKFRLKLWIFLKQNLFRRKLAFISIVAIVCFLCGVAIQFFCQLDSDTNDETYKYAHLKGMKPHYIKKQYSSSDMSKSGDNVLNSLFISVKTTQKYHHPRVIVQLETWASLVKEQVRFEIGSDFYFNFDGIY